MSRKLGVVVDSGSGERAGGTAFESGGMLVKFENCGSCFREWSDLSRDLVGEGLKVVDCIPSLRMGESISSLVGGMSGAMWCQIRGILLVKSLLGLRYCTGDGRAALIKREVGEKKPPHKGGRGRRRRFYSSQLCRSRKSFNL